ncbi:MAG: hypothetical protein JO156_13930 [Solirubrobacterales bacterium]|nr:hypothetical protein [Solirubrobacterales bacterium]
MRLDRAALVAMLALAAAGGCASAGHQPGATGNAGSATTHTSATGPTTTPAAGEVAIRFPPTAGRSATPAVLPHLRARGHGPRARLVGLGGLDLPGKLRTLGAGLEGFWVAVFSANNIAFNPPALLIVDHTPAACGTVRVQRASRPYYCAAQGAIDLPVSFIGQRVAPFGDAATALLASDLFNRSIEDQVGLTASRSPAILERLVLCLSGVYFTSLEPSSQAVHLGPGDETAVNDEIAAEAGHPTIPGSAGTVTVAELTGAFNQGIRTGSCT